jgi:hypothetical protein
VNSVDRALLVASGTLSNVIQALGSISRVYTEARITIVSRLPLFVTQEKVEKIIELPVSGRLISRICGYWTSLLEIRRTKYDEIFILATSEGFTPLKLFGLACKGTSKFWVNEMGDWFNVRDIRASIVHARWRMARVEKTMRLFLKVSVLSPYLLPRLLYSACRWYYRRSQTISVKRTQTK